MHYQVPGIAVNIMIQKCTLAVAAATLFIWILFDEASSSSRPILISPSSNSAPTWPRSPIVGVLTVPVELDSACVSRRRRLGEGDASCFHSVYVKWLEGAGARVVPIPFDSSKSHMLDLFRSVNGILFTGGDTNVSNVSGQYMKAAKLLYQQVVLANDRGEHVPLWGTCKCN